jgi:xanthine dehydrogenase accessory factor
MSIFTQLAQIEQAAAPAALCIITASHGSTPRRVGSKMIVHPDGRIEGTIGGGEMESRVIAEALAALGDGTPRRLTCQLTDPSRGDPGVCGGTLEIYVEPLLPPPVIVVAGAGHVGKAVAHLAKFLGFRVILTDDRPEFCNPAFAPDADAYLPIPLADLPAHITIGSLTYLILTTRNVLVDVPALPALLDSPAAYIGIIGSKRRWATTRAKLLEMGVPEAKLARVTSPMGLELNAETPEEIAVSIMAEIIMLRRGGDGGRMGA